MSVFDLFRGFFGVPGGQYHGRRDPFFEAMTHDEDDDDDDDEDDGGFHYDGFGGEQQDPFDSAWRFGFSLGPDGMRIHEPPAFGQLLKEMEEIFSQMGSSDPRNFDLPSITPPPSGPGGSEGSSGNPLRDFMLKSSDDARPQWPTSPGENPGPTHEAPFHGWAPFPKFGDILRARLPEDERKEDRDLDSAVSAGGLDQILTPPAGQTPQQPRSRSFFQSVIVTKVVKPDGTVEERRTVKDGQGNEETTVTRSGPDYEGGPRPVSDLPQSFSDMRDSSLFSKFFGGFK